MRQYTSQPVDEPTTLKIYAGADGRFTLYEDDGSSLDYLQGKATWTRLIWNDASRSLTIEPGTPAGIKDPIPSAQRTFRVELLPQGTIKSVAYLGRRLIVNF